METARDLASPALWQQSLERSLARRGRPTRSSLALSDLRPVRDLSRSELLSESLKYSQMRRSAASHRPGMVTPGAGGISALALLAAATLPGLIGGRGGGHAGGKQRVAFRSAGDAHAGRESGLAAGPVARAAVDPALLATAAPALPPALPKPVAAPRSAPAAHPSVATHRSTSARRAAHPAHISSTSRSSSQPVRSAAPAKSPERVALARDASGGVAHARSGGSAPGSAAAPRVPVAPQPSGHPSTGGGALEAASRPVATRPATTRAATTRPAVTTHPVTAPAHAPATPHPVTSTPHPVAAAHPAPKAPAAPAPAPPPSGHYVNPLSGASVTPERIDQGVDYSGSGTLSAIGDGKVTYVGTSGTGWPGAFIEYQLTDGAYSGRYVYYAETISPAAGLHVGQTVHAGEPLASINGGIEIGWGSGVGTQPLAQALGQWSGGSDSSNVASPAGKSFSALVAQLGGPPGKIEG